MRAHWQAIVAGLGMTAAVLGAAEPGSSGTTPPPPKFRVTTSVKTPGGGVTMVQAFVFAETNRFTFVLPAGLRMTSDPATKKISFQAIDGGSALTMQLDEEIGRSATVLKASALREVVLQKHAGGKIIAESAVAVDGKSGPAFDVQWRSANGSQQTTRIGWVPVPGGSVEFSLTASADKFAGQQNYLNQLLLWMRRSDLKGELAAAKIFPPE